MPESAVNTKKADAKKKNRLERIKSTAKRERDKQKRKKSSVAKIN